MAVLVYGDVMLDKYIDGTVHRISPEAPVPIVHVHNEYYTAGGCGNVSKGIAALQVHNIVVSCIGNDANGTQLTAALKHTYTTLSTIVHKLPTTTKVRIVSAKHQLLRYDVEAIQEPTKSITNALKKVIANTTYNIAVLSDYGKGLCTHELCQYIIQNSISKKAKVLVDPKCTDWSRYSGAYLISPNFKEFTAALGHTIPNTNDAIAQAAKELIAKYNINNILITRSHLGMSMVSNSTTLHIPTVAKEVYDVTGAGDTVIATIAALLHQKVPLIKAVQKANKAAAIAVAHFGTYAVSKQDLL